MLAGCVDTAGFGRSGGSFGGSGSSFGGSGGFGGPGGSFGGASPAGERLAREVCENEIRVQGQRVVRLDGAAGWTIPIRAPGWISVTRFAAQESTPVDPATADLGQRIALSYSDMATSFFDMATSFFKDLLAPEQVIRLLVLTKQRVVGTVCEGYTHDTEKFDKAVTDVLAIEPKTDDGSISPLVLGRIMHGYGIFLAGELAPASHDPESYCAYGTQIIEELSAEPEGQIFLVPSAGG